MQEIVRVRSIKEYFDTYAVNGIGKGMDRMLIRSQLIDAFHKEIYGLVAMRTKNQFNYIPKEGDPEAIRMEAIRIARNVVKEVTKKWIGLCKEFEKYKETSGLLKYDDIALDEMETIKENET